MVGTIIGQGSFTSAYTGANPNPGVASFQAGNPVTIMIPSGADWVSVRNYSKWGEDGNNTVYFQGAATANLGIEFFWQRGMTPSTGIVTYKENGQASLSGDVILTGAFNLYDPSSTPQPTVGASVPTTASTNAVRPVVSTANTAGIEVGTIVRMSNTAQTDVNGIDMVVGAVTLNTSFTLLTATNPLANAPGAIGGAGFYRIVNGDPLFYPRRRFVVEITNAVNAQVSTSVAHQYVAGQAVRFSIPAVSGMTQLNSTNQTNFVTATVVTVVDSYNFTINVDTTAFTPFTWPTIAQQPSSFPEVIPVGEDTALALASTQPQTPIDIFGNKIPSTNTGILSDSTVNTGFLGMTLGSGGIGNALTTPIVGPAGTVHFTAADVIDFSDLMFWVAGKSTYGGL